jgi:hypothetical protein
MTNTKSSHTLIKLITFAVILFIFAYIWKITQVDNSEIITVEPQITETSKPIAKPIRKVSEINSEDDVEDDFFSEEIKTTEIDYSGETQITEDTKKAYKDHYKFNVYLASLRTPEDLLKAMKKFELNKEYDKADQVEQKLIKVFPDFNY